MNRKSLFLLPIIVVAGVLLASCNDEMNRSVITVTSINENEPFFSDVVIDSSGGVFEDYVSIVFQNRPYNIFVTTGPNLPYSDFIVTRYRVDWQRADGGTGVPVSYTGATSISVPSGESVAGSIILVPAIEKTQPLLAGLAGGGEYLMLATITFWGHDGGVDDGETQFQCSLSVNFANEDDS